MTSRIVVLGATGYTGGLVVDSLVARGVRPVLAGRSPERLRAIAARHGDLEIALADVNREDSVRQLVGHGDVLISTVGPFTRFGEPAAEAAAHAGAHYLDSTGEVGFVKMLGEKLHRTARENGSTMIPAFGYDYVPGMLAGAIALERGGADARALRIAYFLRGDTAGGLSSGTRATMVEGLGGDVPTWRMGRLVEVPGASAVRRFPVAGSERPAVLFTGTEVLFLPELAPALQEVSVYLGWFGGASRALSLVSRAAHSIGSTPLGRAALNRVATTMRPRSSGGPDAAARARTSSHVLAQALDDDGQELAEVHLTGPNTYTLTGDLMAEAAIALREGAGQALGVTGPVQAFGTQGLQALAARARLIERMS